MKGIRYLVFNDIASGVVAQTYKTLAAIVAAATAGHRAALLAVNIGCSDNSPVDESFNLQVQRVEDVSAGGAGTTTAVSAAQMARPDSYEVDGNITGGHTYTAEPTTYDATYPLFNHEFNTRGGFFKEWSFESAPKIDNDQLIGILITPRVATARNFSGSLTFQEY